jgi:hypothetical protein
MKTSALKASATEATSPPEPCPLVEFVTLVSGKWAIPLLTASSSAAGRFVSVSCSERPARSRRRSSPSNSDCSRHVGWSTARSILKCRHASNTRPPTWLANCSALWSRSQPGCARTDGRCVPFRAANSTRKLKLVSTEEEQHLIRPERVSKNSSNETWEDARRKGEEGEAGREVPLPPARRGFSERRDESTVLLTGLHHPAAAAARTAPGRRARGRPVAGQHDNDPWEDGPGWRYAPVLNPPCSPERSPPGPPSSAPC